jgi:predicted nucleic acid-binding protein
MRFIDANVFIYLLIRSPKEDYEISKGILRRIEQGEQAATTTAIICEVIDWLEYNNRKKEVQTFLLAINSYLSLSKYSVEWENFMPALKDVTSSQIDFVDALTVQVMKAKGITEIYSHDKDFDRIQGIKRIWK